MSVLSDARLIELIVDNKLVIEPFILENVQPSSIDLTLDPIIKIPALSGAIKIDEDSARLFEKVDISEVEGQTYVLKPNSMLLAQTAEKIGIPRDCNASVHNRSSIARLGVDVALASYINPGYVGKLPIIIKNVGNFDVELVPWLRICQIEISQVKPEPIRDYSQRKDAKYFGEADSLVSLIHKDAEILDFRKLSVTERDESGLAQFLRARIEARSKEIVSGMTDDLKKELGLL